MDAECFKQIIMPMRDSMYRVALTIVGNEDDAADVIQDTVVSLWDKRAMLRKAVDPKAYCIGAVRNRSITLLRSRRVTVPIETASAISDHETHANAIDNRDTIRLLREIISTLSASQRRVVELSIFSQCDNDEIARITGFSEQNVRTLLSRGRRKIKELFTLQSPEK